MAMAFDEAADLVGRVCGGSRRAGDADGDGLEHVAEDLAIERGLAAEVVVDHRLVDARGAGDAIDAGAGEPAGGELSGRSREQPLPRRGAAGLLTPSASGRASGVCS